MPAANASRILLSPAALAPRIRLAVIVCFLAIFSSGADLVSTHGLPGMAFGAEPGIRLSQYQGELTESSSGENAILRRFEVLLMSSDTNQFFNVLDDAKTGCPWPDSFGTAVAGGSENAVQPHLLYTFEGTVYSIVLPPLLTGLPADAEVDASWEQDGWKMTLIERRSVDGTDCWMVEARERRGRRQTLFVESSSGVLVRSQSDVFMGQGVQFRLTLNRSAVTELAAAAVASLTELQPKLLALQKSLNRRIDSQLSELSARQIETAEAERPALHQLAEGTPLQELIMRMSVDLKRQSDRLMATTSRAGQLINSDAPKFSLNLVNGGTLESSQLEGKVVVLHFWEYRNEPLSEPYGQTGYLDFIYNQRRKLNVQVVGVTTSQDFLTAENLSRGKRSARKLAEFMNLTYPIAYDDGSLLRSFGDPRESNGQLPLWIVLTASGKVAHYHAGFYEIDVAKGLQQLDEILIREIRNAKEPVGKQSGN